MAGDVNRVIWVSPTGNDTWSGSAATADATKGIGPKATLAAAVTAARADGVPTTIYVKGGDYYLKEAIRIGSADKDLTITAAPGEKPVLHGGVDLSKAKWTAEGNGVYSTTLDPKSVPKGVLDLHIDGDRQTPARFPNGVEGQPDKGWLFAAKGTSGYDTIKFKPGEIPQLTNSGDLRVAVYDDKQWTSNIAKVASIDYASGTIKLADNVPWHQLGEGSRYYLFNSKSALDKPGEWFFDQSTSKLYLKPEDPAALKGGHQLVAATTDSLIEISDTQNVKISGLELRDGSPHGSDRGYDYLQIGGGAIKITDSHDITIEGNKIANVGVGINALDLTDSKISGNTVEHTAGNGIHLGLPWGGQGSARVEITDNVVKHVGEVFVEAGGIFFTGTKDSVIARNVVEDSSQFGIYGGQIRDTGVDAIRNNVIERNVVRDVNNATADGGGIKLYARVIDGSTDNVIRYNWVDDVGQLMSKPDGSFFAANDWSGTRWPQPIAAGIYLDWNSKGTQIIGNAVTNSWGGVLIVNGDDTLVKGNLIQGGYGTAFELVEHPQAGRPQMGGNLFTSNVVVRDDPRSAAIKIYDPDGGTAGRFEGNVYSGSAIDKDAFLLMTKSGYGTWTGDFKRWSTGGWDAKGEKLINPGFVDAAHDDFSLSASSPLPGLGIPALDAELLRVIKSHGSFMPPSPPPPPPPPPPFPGKADATTVKIVASEDAYKDAWTGPHAEMQLLVDGKPVADKVLVTAAHADGKWQTFTFTIDKPPTAIDKLQISFLNDAGVYKTGVGWVQGQDRNLYIQSVTIDGKVVDPKQGTWLPHWGQVLPGTGELKQTGMLELDLDKLGIGTGKSLAQTAAPLSPPSPPPAGDGHTKVTVVASEDAYKDAWTGPHAEMQLMVNGQAFGSKVTVTAEHATGKWQTFNFDIDKAPADIHDIGVAFLNDAGVYKTGVGWVPGQDRNLYVQSVAIEGKMLAPEQASWLPHWGQVLSGTASLMQRGTLDFDLAKLGPFLDIVS